MEARLYDKYVTEVVPALQQKFGYKNVNQIPKIDKVVLNMGLGDCKDNPKALEAAVKELEAIAGQKAVTTKAKKSIANFKLREGMNIGAKVTLRGERMYEFVDKLMNIALPGVTSTAYPTRRLTGVETMRWASASSCSSPKSITTRWKRYAAWK